MKSPRVFLLISLVLAGTALWYWRSGGDIAKTRGPGVISVSSALVATQDMPVRLTATGTVVALQTVDVRAQISAVVREVFVKEGQSVRKGDRLFSLDSRSEEAALGRVEAQLGKSRVDLVNAERNLRRQKELFEQKFISQTGLDTIQSQVDSLRAQVAADQAAVEASKVTRGFGEMLAPISGRTGLVNIYPGTLVQPSGNALLSISQIDPINVSFTLPEREFPSVKAALARGEVTVTLAADGNATTEQTGRLVFIDNAVDSASGTIRLKATFANAEGRLWPGMFVTVNLSPRQLQAVNTVPVQAVQIGPEQKFVYVIGDERKVTSVPVKLLLVQDGVAAIEGVAAGTRVVVEGAQNLRPGGTVADKSAAPANTEKSDKAPERS
jgi:RND family efflux transporter MFP subunit